LTPTRMLIEGLLVGAAAQRTCLDYTVAQTTRATVSTPIRAAPASRSARVHAASVAPVVKTSSTTSTCRPAAAADARNAPRTFAHRASAERSLCGWVVRTRATH